MLEVDVVSGTANAVGEPFVDRELLVVGNPVLVVELVNVGDPEVAGELAAVEEQVPSGTVCACLVSYLRSKNQLWLGNWLCK